MALAAMLHDIGKFAERAAIDVDKNTLDSNKQLYSRFQQTGGYFTHIHAAYTGIAIDLIEPHLPQLRGEQIPPFASWKSENTDDSLINAAACHHKPNSYMQWIIATADRVASGFEREEFNKYNDSKDETENKKTHYTARQLTLFEQVQLNGGGEIKRGDLGYRYRLAPLSPTGIFPVKAASYEKDDKTAAQAEYRQLWDAFLKGVADIPKSHRENLTLWLDHFDTLWLTYTHAIPSATAFGVKPDVSLYDHSKAVAALAVALWRYHHDSGRDTEAAKLAMKDRSDWQENKFLLIQGDFFGIQDFIFASGRETQKKAAKLLRGRSFYVSLLAECAALKILDALELPSTSQIINAAGKFLIVAPNTNDIRARLEAVQKELDGWFLQHTFGQSGIGLATVEANCEDFSQKHFGGLTKKLFGKLEEIKLKRFQLCAEQPIASVFENFLDGFDNTKGVCKINGQSPAVTDEKFSLLAADQIKVGESIVKHDRLLITREGLNANTLKLPLFGYAVNFTGNEEASGKFGEAARSGNLLRAWDFSLPQSADSALWNGYARRYINGYVPKFDEENFDWDADKYGKWKDEVEFDRGTPIKTLNHIACENRTPLPNPLPQGGEGINSRWIGQTALITLKGDVDNLGLIMREGLGKRAPARQQGSDTSVAENMTFAKMAGISRQFNAFFALYLPWLCSSDPCFKNTYTVFAGGDDFFLIGPWKSQLELAQVMHEKFAGYVVNPEIHFSAGMSMSKPGLPIRALAVQAEQALDEAKTGGKNAVVCFGERVGWDNYATLLRSSQRLDELRENHALSTGYIYGLLKLTEMAANQDKHPADAIWRSWLGYRTRRFVVDKLRGKEEAERKRIHTELVTDIETGISTHKAAYKIALYTHLYQRRD